MASLATNKFCSQIYYFLFYSSKNYSGIVFGKVMIVSKLNYQLEEGWWGLSTIWKPSLWKVQRSLQFLSEVDLFFHWFHFFILIPDPKISISRRDFQYLFPRQYCFRRIKPFLFLFTSPKESISRGDVQSTSRCDNFLLPFVCFEETKLNVNIVIVVLHK